MGLFVVLTTVEHHGGTVRVGRSRLGGAEFRNVLPSGVDTGGVRDGGGHG